jgi:hypothetical protein|tara:strand:+ start:2027 stop:2809 length:783 start_codon:yes stop_codon:yes gene_type:complete
MIEKLKEKLLPLKGNERTKFLRDLKSYVYVYCEITDENKRIPIYIGKGKSDRFFSHLNDLSDLSILKNKKIYSLLSENKLGIDLLAYGLDDQIALTVESACIDLMGINNLTNIVRGQGDNVKRLPLNELTNLLTKKTIRVAPEHKGVSILINRDYRPTFGDLEIFEITRGIWTKKMVTISQDAKYAYATFKGVVKEVYEIHSWVPAGTQEYFTRSLDTMRLEKARWEFVGRKASQELRDLYVGKIIERKRSYGDPFIKVG